MHVHKQDDVQASANPPSNRLTSTNPLAVENETARGKEGCTRAMWRDCRPPAPDPRRLSGSALVRLVLKVELKELGVGIPKHSSTCQLLAIFSSKLQVAETLSDMFF
ncbi:hypothetical protein AGIG_G21771 [Arapaima gigas]